MSRRTNLALSVLVPTAFVTGVVAFTVGGVDGLHPAVIHGALGMAVVVLAPWKAIVINRGLQRRRPSRILSVGLLLSSLATIGSGAAHAAGWTGMAGVGSMQVHVGAGVAATVFLVGHVRARPVRVRSTDLGRRSAVRTGLLTGAAALVWVAWEGVLDLTGATGGRRRATGSHVRGSFDPSGFPVTSWLDDRIPPLRTPWTVEIDGSPVDVATLDQGDEMVATLDCTGGWYTTQLWSGTRLDRLLRVGEARSVEVVSATGYARRLPASSTGAVLLATRVGGQPLTPGHGAPVRLVVPGRRGFWWVKWVVAVRTSSTPSWLQLPLPAT